MRSRLPTIDELASAFRYIEREYTLKEGNIDGEQWAEGLAFGRQGKDPDFHEYVAIAEHMLPQLTPGQWISIAERADYLLREQLEPARYGVKS